MDRSEAIGELKEMKTDIWVDSRQMEALSMAIKALEQEPIFDKIRAEILNFKEKCNASDYLGCGILEIIDKYKAESEIHCNCTDAEIAKSFIEDVEAVKDLLSQKSEEK